MLLAPLAMAAATSMSGCISDSQGYPLPGVTIVAKASQVERTTVASADGCFELTDVPRETYRVTARLRGFDNQTRDGVVAAGEPVSHLDFVLTISVVCDCVIPIEARTLIAAWQQADAAFRVRLIGRDTRDPSRGYYRHAAEAVEIYKGMAGPQNARLAILEHQVNAAPGPADSGQEWVIFARWVASEEAFDGIGGGPCCAPQEVAFLIDGGRVQTAPRALSRYVGMSLESFIAEVRALSQSVAELGSLK